MKKIITVLIALLITGSAMFSQERKELKPALLVIDVQKQYMPMMSKDDQESAIENMNWAIWIFRQYDLPVIRVYHTSLQWGPAEGTPEFEFHDSIKVVPEDPMIVKTYGSAFIKTDLDKILKELDVNTLYMCGLSSVGCVLATYMGAEEYDYTAFLVKDGLLSHKEKYTDYIEEIFDAQSVENLYFMMQFTQAGE